MGFLPKLGQAFYSAIVANAQVPAEGPKVLPLKVPFSEAASFEVNVLLTQDQTTMRQIQGVYVDNSGNPFPVNFTTGTQQLVKFPANSFGWIPLFSPDRKNLTIASEWNQDVFIQLYNIPMPCAIFDASNGGGNQYFPAPAGTTTALGKNKGALGDYLDGVLIVPASTSPGAVSVVDGATSMTIFTGGATSVSNLVPFFVPWNSNSQTGAYSITCGANVSAFALGQFT